MSKERELLKRVISGDDDGDFFISNALLKEIEVALAQPEQTKRSPLTEAEISKTLKLSRRSTEWDYGFEAGVRFAEEFHGIEL
jgi:hypothetical protein